MQFNKFRLPNTISQFYSRLFVVVCSEMKSLVRPRPLILGCPLYTVLERKLAPTTTAPLTNFVKGATGRKEFESHRSYTKEKVSNFLICLSLSLHVVLKKQKSGLGRSLSIIISYETYKSLRVSQSLLLMNIL